MSADLHAIAERIKKATVPEDVFGAIGGTSAKERLREVKGIYRHTVTVVHPDRFSGPDAELATECMRQLKVWRDAAEAAVNAGTYGDRKPAAAPPRAPAMTPQTVRVPKGQYVVRSPLAHGDLSDLYECSFASKAGAGFEAVFKVASSPADNDLLENESRVLAAMYPAAQPSEKFYRLLPKLHDTFLLRGSKRTSRRVNVLSPATGHVSLASVMQAYPNGVDFRDMVWMFKRMLMVLGFVHGKKDVVHGAVLPTHVLVHPTEHGARLVDWCYAVAEWSKGKGRVKALSRPHRALYAPEILAKRPPTPATDIYMAAKCAVALLGGDVETNAMPPGVPKPIQGFLKSCLFAAQAKRPDDAWRLHEDFDELLARTVGKPKYRPLVMPATT